MKEAAAAKNQAAAKEAAAPLFFLLSAFEVTTARRAVCIHAKAVIYQKPRAFFDIWYFIAI